MREIQGSTSLKYDPNLYLSIFNNNICPFLQVLHQLVYGRLEIFTPIWIEHNTTCVRVSPYNLFVSNKMSVLIFWPKIVGRWFVAPLRCGVVRAASCYLVHKSWIFQLLSLTYDTLSYQHNITLLQQCTSCCAYVGDRCKHIMVSVLDVSSIFHTTLNCHGA